MLNDFVNGCHIPEWICCIHSCSVFFSHVHFLASSKIGSHADERECTEGGINIESTYPQKYSASSILIASSILSFIKAGVSSISSISARSSSKTFQLFYKHSMGNPLQQLRIILRHSLLVSVLFWFRDNYCRSSTPCIDKLDIRFPLVYCIYWYWIFWQRAEQLVFGLSFIAFVKGVIATTAIGADIF